MGLLLTIVLAGTAFTITPSSSAQSPLVRAGFAWGYNVYGQLGNGTNADSAVPVPVSVPVGVTVTATAAGGHHSSALTSTGQVLAWGFNGDGELGDGTTDDSGVPVPVHLPAGVKVTAIAAGYAHSLALTSTGQVLAWGFNTSGQLGDGTTDDSSVPVPVDLPAGVKITAIAAGYGHSLALTSTGQVLAWGYNGDGELGDGTKNSSDVPVSAHLPTGTTITATAAGEYHSLALTSSGQVLAWGWNSQGALGDGTNNDSDVPVSVRLPSGVRATAVSGGFAHSLALTSTGEVLAWGFNSDGELGDGDHTNSDVPVSARVPAGVTITAIAAGFQHSLAFAGPPPVPSLTLAKNHSGNFAQGGQGTYTITVGNAGPGVTDGTVTVRDSLPAGLTARRMTGSGWSCTLATLTCTRGDALAGGVGYPPITLTVDVSPSAPAQVTNTATVRGGGDTTPHTATDVTAITPSLPSLTIAKSHSGDFAQGRGGTYTITVGNAGPGVTDGTVTVRDSLPAGLTARRMTGSGWSCTLATLTCTRGDALAAKGGYPPIELTVQASCRAHGEVTNTATVTGGRDPSAHKAQDRTLIRHLRRCHHAHRR